MENSKVKLSGESHFRFRNRWPDCKSGNVPSGNTIAAQRRCSDVRVKQVTPESFPTFLDENGLLRRGFQLFQTETSRSVERQLYCRSEHKAIYNCRLNKENK
jgi:hypothetical protein